MLPSTLVRLRSKQLPKFGLRVNNEAEQMLVFKHGDFPSRCMHTVGQAVGARWHRNRFERPLVSPSQDRGAGLYSITVMSLRAQVSNAHTQIPVDTSTHTRRHRYKKQSINVH